MIPRRLRTTGGPVIWFVGAVFFAAVTIAFVVMAHRLGWNRRYDNRIGIAGGVTLACVGIGIDRAVRRRGRR